MRMGGGGEDGGAGNAWGRGLHGVVACPGPAAERIVNLRVPLRVGRRSQTRRRLLAVGNGPVVLGDSEDYGFPRQRVAGVVQDGGDERRGQRFVDVGDLTAARG